MRYTLTVEPTNAVAFLTPPNAFVGFIADAIEAETGRQPKLSTTGGTSDARFIVKDCPVVEFGLVGQTMHQIDERVAGGRSRPARQRSTARCSTPISPPDIEPKQLDYLD